MRSRMRLVVAALSAPAIIALTALGSGTPTVAGPVIQNKVIAAQLNAELGRGKRIAHLQPVSGGVMDAVYQMAGISDARARAATGSASAHTPPTSLTQGCANTYTGGAGVSNVRANQDCGLRRQAEEAVAVNPTNHANVIAGQNDSRVGYNHCGYDFSFDGGVTWGDTVPPFYQTILPDGHTADACSDPSVTFDSQGNAYIVGILFDVAALANGMVVAKSNAGIGGAFWHSPVAGAFQEYLDTPLGIVAADRGLCIFNDKEFIVADATVSSTKADNVYVTWTRYDACTGAGVGAHSPIYFSQSTDGGATWSRGIEISGSNASFCTDFSGESDPNACDQDQGSHPVVGADGTVYVAFGNGNTPTAGINQHMVVSCRPTKDCSKPSGWTDPVKISDDFGLQPTASAFDPVSGCPGGRQCLPTNGYRMDDFVEGSISVDTNGDLFFVWADGRNLGPNCQGDYASAAPPCNNDVFSSFSSDGGNTWSGAANLTAGSPYGQTAQWMPWSAVTPDGGTLWVAFYDRHYGSCETSGCNDITQLEVTGPASGTPTVTATRLTTRSMPNLVVANNPAQAGFIGDYMWVTAPTNGDAPYVAWADTRGLGHSVEEDIYVAR